MITPVTEVTNKQIELLADVYRLRKREFLGDDAEYASRSFASQQHDLHRQLFNEAATCFAEIEPVFRMLVGFAGNMGSAVTNINFQRKNVEGRWIVSNNVNCPIIQPQDAVQIASILRNALKDVPDDSRVAFAADLGAAFIATTLTAYRYLAFTVTLPDGFGGLEQTVRHFVGRTSALEANQHDHDFSRQVVADLQAQLAAGKVRLDHFQEREQKIAKEIDDNLQRMIEGAKSQEEVGKRIAGFETQIDNAVKAAAEKGKLASANAHWMAAQRSASAAFWISTIALAGALIGIPVLCGIYWREIIAVIAAIQSQLVSSQLVTQPSGSLGPVGELTVALSKLLIITVPVGMLIWMLRLVVRFNTRSLLLMDDAKQRKTMLETFIFMIEQDAATKQDRGALLEALFRPVPGHGAHNVEAPNFTDLLRYGQESSAK